MTAYKVGDWVLIRAKVLEARGGEIGYSVELFSKTDQYAAWVRPDLITAKARRPEAPEADRRAVVKDTDGHLWTWDARQQAWSCRTDRDGSVLTWESLDTTLGPLQVYEASQ